MKTKSSGDYELASDGSFIIRNYNQKKTFSNFLPGIAGVYGTPMWVFYVNRGQGVSSFGVRNKDSAMLEFFPANKAYQMTSRVGFRTFLKYSRSTHAHETALFYEPFKLTGDSGQICDQRMMIRSSEFQMTERNVSVGLETEIVYFTVPSEPLAVLARQLSIKNIAAHPIRLELLDGLPTVNPYGMNQFFIKEMSRTIEAWMIVENMQRQAPYMRLRVDAGDRPEVTQVKEGNFYFAVSDGGISKPVLAQPIVDPERIFGHVTDFSRPERFLGPGAFEYPENQICFNKTPCAFSYATAVLAPGKTLRLDSFFGSASDAATLNHYVGRASRAGYLALKRQENRQLIESVKSRLFTVSADPLFDLYCGQTYLDNVIRGGLSVEVCPAQEPLMYYAYTRKHGDLERDYNRFLVEPAYYSQGDGNYRDVNQNRRSDVWLDPRVKDFNINLFYNLIQLDGYNPLVVNGTDFYFQNTAAARKALEQLLGARALPAALDFMKKPFKLGALLRFLESNQWTVRNKFPALLAGLRPHLEIEQKAEHGEGYWTDHWTYNLDLVESYLAIYPEDFDGLLFKRRGHTFFDNDRYVVPRDKRYFIRNGQLRQYRAVAVDKIKSDMLASRRRFRHQARTRYGKGSVYHTNLFTKMLCLFVNKAASLDPAGIGIQMEADKPSWYDALNGLPGLLGSSTPEAFELKRLGVFMLGALREMRADIKDGARIPRELAEFLRGLARYLDRVLSSNARERLSNYDYWDRVETLKEKYRAKTLYGISGNQTRISYLEIRSFLEKAVRKIDNGLEHAVDPKTGLHPTYFENRAVEWRTPGRSKKTVSGDPAETPLSPAWPLRFESRALPMFLEGPVHAMKIEKDPQKRRMLYRAVRQSDLYDKGLGMYKVNAPMQEASLEVGRGRIFSPGWLENESIWLHMEYKWLLEVLKAGLMDEFLEDFRRALIPFQPPERYGRSILENSSFLASSAFVDPKLRGTGFVARLSGSTAELVQIWLLLMAGKKPFSISHDGRLILRFEPHLPASFFVKEETERTLIDRDGVSIKIKIPKNCVAFMFLGKTLVVYHNPKRLDTFGKLRVSVKRITLTDRRGKRTAFEADGIPAPFAQKVRQEFMPRIDVELG